MKKLFFSITMFICLVSVPNVKAVILNCDGSQSDCQSKITAASDGDTIVIPSGTFSWASGISWTNKNITVVGGGIDITNININASFGFIVYAHTKANFRISGITINQLANGTAIKIFNNKQIPTGGSYSTGWRLDHLKITANGLSNVRSFSITGLTYGLIDNVIWSSDYPIAQFLTHYGYTNDGSESGGAFGQGAISWSLDHSLGDNNAIYVEDCIITGSSTGGWAADVWYGGEVVFRHNAINRCQISTHGARYSARGGRRIEAYNNTFIASGMNDKRVIWWRSGSGVAFNNTIDSAGSIQIDNQRSCLQMVTRCDGIEGNAYDMNIDGNGWPCLDQPGRWQGSPLSQSSEPVYAWYNGTQADCATDQSTCVDSKHITLNSDFDLCTSDAPPSLSTHLKTIGDASPHTGNVVDYVNNGSTPKPGYTSYTYPHPLRGETWQPETRKMSYNAQGPAVVAGTGPKIVAP